MFSMILALSFAWMWTRNEKARKNLKRIGITDGMDQATFTGWLENSHKRLSRADLAAVLLTIMPIAAFLLGGIGANLCGWPALILAFSSNSSGRKADKFAKQIGFQRGVKWLTDKHLFSPTT